jgi:hypothetical protein
MSDMNNPSDENSSAMDDLWADALNEQKPRPAKVQPTLSSNNWAAVMSVVACRTSI